MRVVHIRVDPVQLDLYRIEATYRRKLMELKEKHRLARVPGLAVPLWKTLKGRGTSGERALVFAREYYRKRGYKVWTSGSGKRADSFMLLSFPGLRRRCHPGFMRMLEMFDPEAVFELIHAAEDEKRGLPGNLGGGDPDLFVFKENGGQKRFFVEAKHKDKLSPKQKACFKLIEKLLGCDVVIGQIMEKKRPRCSG